MKPLLFLSALIIGASFIPTPSFAQESDAEMMEPSEAVQSDKSKSAMNKVMAEANAIMEGLSTSQARHFNIMYGNYNLIKVVETIREDLGNAIESCGEANPDIKEEADARYEEWTGAVDPVLKEANGNVANMIVAQDYARPREIDKFFKLVDNARSQHGKDVEKVPVTSLEACQTMVKKMDDTQPNMIELLEATLISLPLAIEAEREKERAELKAAEEAEAAKAAEEEQAAEDAEEEEDGSRE